MKLFDVNPNGIVEHIGKKDGKVVIKRTQDVENILDLNNQDKINTEGGWKGDFHKVASIPYVVIDMWRAELKAMGADDTNPTSAANKKFFIAKLNDYNYSRLRTKEGVI